VKTRISIALISLLLLLGLTACWIASRREIVRVDKGPVGEHVVARAAVEPAQGLVHLYAASDGRVLRVRGRQGDQVEAGAVLAELEVAGKREELKAPARGVVLARHLEVGDYAVSAQHGAREPCFELADSAETQLRIEVEEADAARIATGQNVRIRPTGFAPAVAQGRIERVSARLEPRSIGSDDARVRAGGWVRSAVVSWVGERPAWPIGARAEAVIELRRSQAAARVPRSALTVRDGRTVVEQPFGLWTRRVPVTVVNADEVYAEIRGLGPGSEVIVLK
jgi:multidrug efflux pump subunit AcrA (membrane-fusion protein)